MSCSEGDKVKWSDFYDMGVKIDDLADSLNTPDYERLDSRDHTPWPLASTINDSFYMRFEVAGGADDGECTGCIITKRCMSDGAGAPYTFPDPVLQNLADDNNLFFVTDSTDCWCKYIFQVVKSDGGDEYTLKTLDDTPECCTTMDVPEVGDPLCYNQHWIPAAYVKDWKYRYYSGPSRTFNVDACRKPSAEQVQLYFEDGPTSGGNPLLALVAAERHVTGYFTWRIKTEWVNLLRESLDYITACNHSGGVKDSELLRQGHDLGSGDFVPETCAVNWCGLNWNGFAQWGNDGESPGCLSSADVSCCTPWDEACCGGESCNDGQSVYCETLTQLNNILDNIVSSFHPWESGGANCPDCCDPVCSLTVGGNDVINPGDSILCTLNNADNLRACAERYGTGMFLQITVSICTENSVRMRAIAVGHSTPCSDPMSHCVTPCSWSNSGCPCDYSCQPAWAPGNPLCADAVCNSGLQTCADCATITFDLSPIPDLFTVDIVGCAWSYPTDIGHLGVECHIIKGSVPP